MDWSNYECDGQMTLDDFVKVKAPESETVQKITRKQKPLKYYMSLSAYYTKCPYCKAENQEELLGLADEQFPEPHTQEIYRCKRCKHEMNGIVEIKSKDYRDCEALGLKGCVTKDDKGRWAEVHFDAKGNRYLTYGGDHEEKQQA